MYDKELIKKVCDLTCSMEITVKNTFERIDALYDYYLSVWKDVCDIESPTRDKAGLDACCDYFVRIARERGWDVEVLKDPTAGNVASITLNPRAEGKPLCFSGHLDTVHEKGLFGYPPTKIEGDKIYGPGVADCKGGAVAAMLAMDALDREGFRARPIRLILQSDEEMGSRPSERRTINYMIEKARDAVAFLNLEPHVAGSVCIARKGIATYTFTVKGVAAHASLCAKQGANALLEAAHKIIELEKIKDDEGLTCCCSVIEAGKVSNTVPEVCVFKADVRYATLAQREAMDAHARRIAETVYVEGCSTTFTRPARGRIMMELCERNLSLCESFNAALEKAGLARLKGYKRAGGSDAADITEAGIPCLDSLGVEGEKIHSHEEYALTESLRTAAQRLVAAAYYI